MQYRNAAARFTSDWTANRHAPRVEWPLPGNLGGDADRLELASYRLELNTGSNRIVGTTKIKALPADLPVRRPVLLYRELDGALVASTYSDAVTGEYVFNDLPAQEKYTVVAYDVWDKSYRAVLADNLSPESMP